MHAQGEFHYFYWDWDGYNPFDYEPVGVYTRTDSKTLLSRFHWHVLNIWRDVVEEDSKPSIEFTSIVHIPIAKSRNRQLRYMDWGLSLSERIEIVNMYAPLLELALVASKFRTKREKYGSKIVESRVPDKYLMSYSEMKAAFCVGGLPEPEEVPESLRKEIWAGK